MNNSSSRPFVGGHGRLLAVLSAGVVALLTGQLVVAPAFPAIIVEFDIAPSTVGGGLPMMWICAALAMYPGGRSSDLLSRKTVLVSSVGVLVVAFLAVVSALTFPAFFVGLAVVSEGPLVVAAGIGLFAVRLLSFWPVMNAYLMARLAGWRLRLSWAVFFGVGSLGPLYTGLVVDYASYRAAYAGLIGYFLASAVLVRFVE